MIGEQDDSSVAGSAQDAILFDDVIDHVLLPLVHRARNRNNKKRKRIQLACIAAA